MLSNSKSKSALPGNWAQLKPEEKRQFRLNSYLDTAGINFVSPQAKDAYTIRAKRMVAVMNVQEPDRVPVDLRILNLPLALSGLNAHAAMYDQEKVVQAYADFNQRYADELDFFAFPRLTSGKALDLLDYRLYRWPGHGIGKDADGWQYVEGEYMSEDEYDDLIRDPSDFWLRTYLPRVFGALEPLGMFQPLTEITENVHLGSLLTPLSSPPVQQMLQKMLDAGRANQQTARLLGQYAGMGPSRGFPNMASIFCKAPFDTLGDTLRGTRGIMSDIFRRPHQLLEALDVIADLTINTALKSPLFAGAVIAGYPLHKGADGWMSQQQFDTFYWPSLKKVMSALIREGLIQRLFAEGGYNTRLEAVNEFPRGTVIWHFDKTDMFRAKSVLGDSCCLQGNVPVTMLMMGKPSEVKEYCRKLIEGCGRGGGFILSPGAVGNTVKLDNILAMVQAAREYGTY
jgi:hypothetical protein